MSPLEKASSPASVGAKSYSARTREGAAGTAAASAAAGGAAAAVCDEEAPREDDDEPLAVGAEAKDVAACVAAGEAT